MAETKLRAEKTPLVAIDVYLALRVQWTAQVGTPPQRSQLLTILSQVWLETGAGHACYGNNLGGIKHVPGDGHDWYEVQTIEVRGGQSQTLVQPFRSYPTLKDGAADYLHLLRTTFGFAWPAIEAGDVSDYAHRLKARGYYTADEQTYAAGLAIRYKQLETQIPDDTDPDMPVAIARTQPSPGDDNSDQPLPPGDLPDPPDEPA